MTNSANVTPIIEKQPATSARFTVQALIDGFPVTVEVEGRADAVKILIDKLKAIGAEPPVATKAEPTASQSKAIPVCPIHHTQMKPSRKPGSFFCPKRTDDGQYCPEKA